MVGVGRCRRRCARSASIRTSIEHAAARHRRSATKPGATVRLGDYFGKRPVVLVFVYYDCPMLCTQVLNGLASALGVLSLDAGRRTSRSSPSASIRARRRRWRPAKKADYLERYKRPGAAARLALPDRRASRRSTALTQGGRLPLRLGRGDEAVRAPDRHHRAHARRPAGAVSVRHRVRPARSAARARRSVGRQGRLARRLRCCSTAITTTR